jgi:hypothetical protein
MVNLEKARHLPPSEVVGSHLEVRNRYQGHPEGS